MATIVLLGNKNDFSMRANKTLHLLIGILFILNGSLQVYRTSMGAVGYIIGIPTLLMGIFYLWYAFIITSPKSKFAPKVAIDMNSIFLKNRLLGAAKTLLWADVKSITFKQFEIVFVLQKNEHSFSYDASTESSIMIKEALREYSEKKGIEVYGG